MICYQRYFLHIVVKMYAPCYNIWSLPNLSGEGAGRKSLMTGRIERFIRKIPLLGYFAWWVYTVFKSPSKIKALSDEMIKLKEEERKLCVQVTKKTDEMTGLRGEMQDLGVRLIKRIDEIEKLNQRVSVINTQLNDLINTNRSNSSKVVDEIDHLLNTQVEHYQPIYGIPGTFFTTKPKRDCYEKAQAIENYFDNDVKNLRVLDIGSSLGYFCFYLADREAFTEGWESNELNYYVSNLIKEINEINNAKFFLCTLDVDTVKTIPYDYYDCALVLNVFHHIANEHGLDYCQTLVKDLLDKIPILIVELANKNENADVYWKDKLPLMN